MSQKNILYNNYYEITNALSPHGHNVLFKNVNKWWSKVINILYSIKCKLKMYTFQ